MARCHGGHGAGSCYMVKTDEINERFRRKESSLNWSFSYSAAFTLTSGDRQKGIPSSWPRCWWFEQGVRHEGEEGYHDQHTQTCVDGNYPACSPAA